MKNKHEQDLELKNAELEKQLAAKNRDLEIETSLERVRARTMAMQHSEELAETVSVLFKQLLGLGIKPEQIRTCGIVTFNTYEPVGEQWITETNGEIIPQSFIVPYDEAPAYKAIYEAWKNGEKFKVIHLEGEPLKQHLGYLAKYTKVPVRDVVTPQQAKEIYNHVLYFSQGCLFIITKEALPEYHNVFKRFGSVFQQAYTRFLDLQKAEAQARESQIQLALERVRARTMAMQKSEELAETAYILFQQFKELGESPDQATIGIINEEEWVIEYWVTMYGSQINKVFKFSIDEPNVTNRIYKAWKKQQKSLVIDLTGKELDDFTTYRAKMGGAVREKTEKRRVINVAFFSKGLINVQSAESRSAESICLLERFAGVFDGTYTRFLDLQRAEAQAREAQIEAALEKVRSRSLAMHKADELQEVVNLVFEKLLEMGISLDAVNISIPDEKNKSQMMWVAANGIPYPQSVMIPYNDDPVSSNGWDAWFSGVDYFSKTYSFDEKNQFFNWAFEHSDLKYMPAERKTWALQSPAYAYSIAFGKVSAIWAVSYSGEQLTIRESETLKRFGRVFDQAYTRFNDLKQAEAQAREAQIELSLERVRAKTMAMHTSEHVGETVATMFDELVKLGIEKTVRCGILIIDETKHMEVWTAAYNTNGKVDMLIGRIDMMIHPLISGIHQAWKNKEQIKSYELRGEDLIAYYRAVSNSPEYPVQFDLASLPAKQTNNAFFFPEGAIFAFTLEPLSADAIKLFKRFAGVFGQTYRRYLDLLKAEAAAREAQIEAALERVRSKAMAMRSSGDLNDTANTVFIELRKLGIDLVRCGLGLQEKGSHITTIHAATNSDEGGNLEVLGQINMNIHPVFEGSYNHWRQNKDYFPVLEAESLRTYYEALHKSGISVPEWKSGEKQYGYFLQFAYGSLYAWSGKQESEITIKTFKRFTSVIGLTYTRYIELQKAESNTKEAIKQASLDRVRAEIASMRKRSDLERITPLIWDELTILGIPFIRCGVFIMDEAQKLIHTFLSTPDGKAIGAFHVPFDTSGNFEIMVDNWRHKEPYIDHWKEEAFSQFADALVKQRAISSKAQYMRTLPHEGVHLNFLPFLQGMLYVGNVSPLAEDNIDLIQAVADAFSTAYARYEDFNKLEAAKQQVDNTLIDLKAAQTKLIQSEKMASLGELTAGIAHEIQNPLNFVNNFSEVNQEMIDELEEALKAGNIEEALAIAADIKQNEEKISHHGKRADGIVKGMLQHSRTGGGEKQLTNMNVLADEFLRLSYHGLRAKDKTFNAEMITHFDPNLPKASVIAQDMGRVLLNLFNNAFYAVNQKKKTAGADYRPEVSVSTSVENGQVIIKVKDNGTGMPDHVKEKIMQPFFTTKPTGEGTGLGLSLTYDMVVKGHGGTIQVNSVEGEGSEFIIQLLVN